METLERTVKAVSVRNIDEGAIGFLTNYPGEEHTWRNVIGETEALQEIVKNIIAKGNTISFEVENGAIGSVRLIKAAQKDSSDLTNFETLLNDAYSKGLVGIRTDVVNIDMEKKFAVFKAIVFMNTKNEHGELVQKTFEAYGDATQDNCGELVQKHFIRMAETRAIARALRWATNNAKAAVEETESDSVKEE